MTNNYAKFCILGEVTEMLLPEKEVSRLLIDISAGPDEIHEAKGFVYRTSFSVTDPELIEAILGQVSPGDVIEATGAFWQTGYVPHRTTYIDTTFRLSGYRLIRKRATPVLGYGPCLSRSASQTIH